MKNYYKCICCDYVFRESQAPVKRVNITDNHWEDYYVCPECGESALAEASKEEWLNSY